MYYTHDKFTDVMLELITSFYIKEKKVYDCKVVWWSTRGWPLCMPYRMKITKEKMSELRRDI